MAIVEELMAAEREEILSVKCRSGSNNNSNISSGERSRGGGEERMAETVKQECLRSGVVLPSCPQLRLPWQRLSQTKMCLLYY